MITRLIGWSARNLLLVFVGTVFAIAAGLYALRTLPLDATPDLSDVQVIVYTDYPGQAPQVVEARLMPANTRAVRMSADLRMWPGVAQRAIRRSCRMPLLGRSITFVFRNLGIPGCEYGSFTDAEQRHDRGLLDVTETGGV